MLQTNLLLIAIRRHHDRTRLIPLHRYIWAPAASTGSLDEKRAAFRRVRDQLIAHFRKFLTQETGEQRH